VVEPGLRFAGSRIGLFPANRLLLSVLGICLVLLLSGATPADSGYLTVRCNSVGIAVYLDGEFLGRTPVEMHRLKPGQYSISTISNDSLENVYWRIREGSVGAKLSSVWQLAAVNAGTVAAQVERGKVTEVMIDYGKVLDAPTEAKLIACGSVGGIFLIGAVVGFLVHLVASR
jgi:hypothetical protein